MTCENLFTGNADMVNASWQAGSTEKGEIKYSDHGMSTSLILHSQLLVEKRIALDSHIHL
jgi:hypothetical protein